MRILGISGSLRRGSNNRRLLRAAGALLPPGAELVEWDGLATLPCVGDGDGVGDVAFVELVRNAFEVGGVARVGERVEDAHVVAGGLEPLGEVRADEAGPAGDEHAHRSKAT